MTALAGWIGDWSPGIGDPNFAGWFTVAAYFAAALLCRRARRVARDEARAGTGRGGSAALWSLLAMGLAALGINKQLDLQTALTEIGREVARAGGWFDRRHVVQRWFIVVVGILAVASSAWLAFLARRESRRVLLALIGWTALCAFVAVRAASIHDVDHLLGTIFAGATVNSILEIGGIACVAVGALTYARAPK